MKLRLIPIVVLTVTLGLAAPAQSAPRAPGGLQLTPYAGVAWYLIGFELGPWEQYLIHELTPDLDRLAPKEAPRISWLQVDERVIVPEFALSLFEKPQTSIALSLRESRTTLLMENAGGSRLRRGSRFEQSLIMPGLTHKMADGSALSVSAVLARQRFGAPEMNLERSDERIDPGGPYLPYYDPTYSEVSRGTGLRFALSSEVVSGLTMEAAFQSRIGMDEFASVNGVHGTNAKLDIPPRVQFGMAVHATPRSWLNFGVSQIFYSDVGAFPSRALPARFTALLGDRNSPQFAWEDLVVYNLGWHWRHDSDLEIFVDYRTRSQPRPSAPSLAAALDSELAQNMFMVGFSKGVGSSRFELNAAYAPPEYAFGGNVLGVVTDKLDQGVELQALLKYEF